MPRRTGMLITGTTIAMAAPMTGAHGSREPTKSNDQPKAIVASAQAQAALGATELWKAAEVVPAPAAWNVATSQHGASRKLVTIAIGLGCGDRRHM